MTSFVDVPVEDATFVQRWSQCKNPADRRQRVVNAAEKSGIDAGQVREFTCKSANSVIFGIQAGIPPQNIETFQARVVREFQPVPPTRHPY